MDLRRAYKLGFAQGLAAGVKSVDELSDVLRAVPTSISIDQPKSKDAPLPARTEDDHTFANEFHRLGGNTQSQFALDQMLPPDGAV